MSAQILPAAERAYILSEGLRALIAGRGDYTEMEREVEIADCKQSLKAAIYELGSLH